MVHIWRLWGQPHVDLCHSGNCPTAHVHLVTTESLNLESRRLVLSLNELSAVHTRTCQRTLPTSAGSYKLMTSEHSPPVGMLYRRPLSRISCAWLSGVLTPPSSPSISLTPQSSRTPSRSVHRLLLNRSPTCPEATLGRTTGYLLGYSWALI